MTDERIIHSTPPVPVPAGSYALHSIPGGYRFLYPIVALMSVRRIEDMAPEWMAVYLNSEGWLEVADPSYETLNLTEDEAAELRQDINARNAEIEMAEEGVENMILSAGREGVPAGDIRRWLWDNHVKAPSEVSHIFDAHGAVTVDGRVYLDKYAPEEANR